MATMEWKRLCCPVDHSEPAQAGLRVAADLCRRLGSELVLLHADAAAKVAEELPPAERTEEQLGAWKAMAEGLGVARVTVARASGEPAAAIAEFAAASDVDLIVMGTHGRVDREQLVSVRGVTTLDEIAAGATSRHRFRAVMVTTFAALALVLAMVGVFGILAYSVQQRVRDFAVRRALGATGADVVRLVTASALRVVAGGVAIGLLLSAALSRLLSTLLFGVKPLDPATFALVSLLLLIGAAVSTAAPALRAARIEPAVALRDE